MGSDDHLLIRSKDPETCEHPKCTPKFDADAAKGLDPVEIRKRWPRFSGECPDCLQRLISYASWMHYIAGDW